MTGFDQVSNINITKQDGYYFDFNQIEDQVCLSNTGVYN